jgi:hypothetical protein
MIKTAKRASITAVVLLISSLGAQSLKADSHFPMGDDETILIEYQPSTKIPYHKILRKIGQHFFKVDTEALTSFGSGKSSSVVRHYSQYLERSKTRFNVKTDEVRVKFSVNF